jgi:hypothetical protein
MHRRTLTVAIALTVVLVGSLAGVARAGAPIRYGDSYAETFLDDFILELCGIETFTTLTERWSFTEFEDGSSILHVTRTFVPEDPRFPVEKGAGTSFFAPDGTQTVVGLPLLLFRPEGGVQLLDAGLVEFGDELTIRGPHPSLDADLALYYCP